MSELQHCGFISLLYSIGDKPLDLWSKHISPDGKIRRVIDEFLNGDKVIEITGPHNVPVCTNITCPADPTNILNIKLPILVLIIKNLQLRFKLEFQILDTKKYRRKFTFLTDELSPKIKTSVARLPLKLEENWNNLEINLQTLCHDIFGVDFDVLQRIVIYSNCHIRRIYFQDRHYEHNETPAKLLQAFFDMYLLKWGIHLVDRNSQTDSTVNTNSQQRNTGSKPKAKYFSTKGKQSKNTKKEEKHSGKNVKKLENNETEFPSTSTNNENHESKINTEKISKFEKNVEIFERDEGNIFSKWPYKFDDFHRKPELVILDKESKTSDFQNQNVQKIKNIMSEVHRIKEQLNNKNYQLDVTMESADEKIPEFVELEARPLEKKSQSKFLTSDKIVNELKSHFKVKRIFDTVKKRFTTTDLDFFIHNPGKRKNDYGQGKLIKSCRGLINKATNYEEVKSPENQNDFSSPKNEEKSKSVKIVPNKTRPRKNFPFHLVKM